MGTEFIDEKFNKILNGDEFCDKLFDRCQFISCDFSDGNFMRSVFEDCMFKGCNLSIVSFVNTKLKNVQFEDCKLSGISFAACDAFLLELNFIKCVINGCTFSNMPLNKSSFIDCNIKSSDFIDTKLREAKFCKSKFSDVIFHNSDLTKADFRDAIGYRINPNNNNIEKAIFSLPEAVNILQSMDIILE